MIDEATRRNFSDSTEEKVIVNAKALRSILSALVGAPHEIRELMALRGSSLHKLTGDRSPIDVVIEEFNEQIRAREAAAAQASVPAEEPPPEDGPRVMPPMPSKQGELGYVVRPFFFDALDHTRPEGYDGMYLNVGIDFGDVCLKPLLNRTQDLLEAADHPPIQGYFDDELEVTSVIARIDTDHGFKLITLDIPGGKRVPMFEMGGNNAFNVTMTYKGRLFTLEAFISWAPATGTLHSIAANLNFDISMQRLVAQLGIEGAVKSVHAHCLHVRGRFHQQV